MPLALWWYGKKIKQMSNDIGKRDVECYVEARVRGYNRQLEVFSNCSSRISLLISGSVLFGIALQQNVRLGITGLLVSMGLYVKYGNVTGESIVRRPHRSAFFASLQNKKPIETKNFRLTEKEWKSYKPHPEDSIWFIHDPPLLDLESRQ